MTTDLEFNYGDGSSNPTSGTLTKGIGSSTTNVNLSSFSTDEGHFVLLRTADIGTSHSTVDGGPSDPVNNMSLNVYKLDETTGHLIPVDYVSQDEFDASSTASMGDIFNDTSNFEVISEAFGPGSPSLVTSGQGADAVGFLIGTDGVILQESAFTLPVNIAGDTGDKFNHVTVQIDGETYIYSAGTTNIAVTANKLVYDPLLQQVTVTPASPSGDAGYASGSPTVATDDDATGYDTLSIGSSGTFVSQMSTVTDPASGDHYILAGSNGAGIMVYKISDGTDKYSDGTVAAKGMLIDVATLSNSNLSSESVGDSVTGGGSRPGTGISNAVLNEDGTGFVFESTFNVSAGDTTNDVHELWSYDFATGKFTKLEGARAENASGLSGSGQHGDANAGFATNGEFEWFTVDGIPVLVSSGRELVQANFFPNVNIVCYARGTLILTDHGEVAIEDIHVGDLVETIDDGLQSVRWMGSRWIYAAELRHSSNLRPIRIKQGALGDGLPVRDLLVSPQHRLLVRSRITRRMFDEEEVLVAAKHLLEIDGIEIADDCVNVQYFHILLDQHHILKANGACAESLFIGAEARKSLTPQGLSEIGKIFPELFDGSVVDSRFTPARLFVSGRHGRTMAARHQCNRVNLLT